MQEGLAVCLVGPGRSALQVLLHVLERRFQGVEEIVHPIQLGLFHNQLIGRHVEVVGPPAGFVGPLPM